MNIEKPRFYITKWFESNSNLIIWIIVLYLLDRFVFSGKYTQKLEDVISELVDIVKGKFGGAE